MTAIFFRDWMNKFISTQELCASIELLSIIGVLSVLSAIFTLIIAIDFDFAHAGSGFVSLNSENQKNNNTISIPNLASSINPSSSMNPSSSLNLSELFRTNNLAAMQEFQQGNATGALSLLKNANAMLLFAASQSPNNTTEINITNSINSINSSNITSK